VASIPDLSQVPDMPGLSNDSGSLYDPSQNGGGGLFGAIANFGNSGGLSSSAIGDIGGAAGDLFGALGDQASAGAFREAAAIDTQNEALAGENTQIQEFMANRKVNEVIGAQRAAEGAAGVSGGGSGAYLLRDSMAQGALTKQIIQVQGAVQQNTYREEAEAHEAQAQAASDAATGGFFSSVFKGIGAALKIAAII
jgi:hypothetical protein